MTLSRSWGELSRLSAKMWLKFALLGLIAPVSYYFVLLRAYDHLPAQIASADQLHVAIILSVLIAVIDRRPVSVSGYAAMAVSLAGVALISRRRCGWRYIPRRDCSGICIRIAVGALLDCQRQSQIVRQRNDLTLPDILFSERSSRCHVVAPSARTHSIRRPPCRMLHRHIRDGLPFYMLA